MTSSVVNTSPKNDRILFSVVACSSSREGGIAVRHHDNAIVMHHGVARGRLAADIGRGAGNQHAFDAAASAAPR